MLSRTHFEGAGHALLNTSIYVIEVLPKERRASLSFMAGRVGFAIEFFITGLGKKKANHGNLLLALHVPPWG